MNDGTGDFRRRVAEVRRKLPLAGVVEQHVKLSGSAASVNRRARCPFHSGNSASFSVKNGNGADGFAHCFGCQWHGDVVRFVQDMFGLSFVEALKECEDRAGIGGNSHRPAAARPEARPVPRARSPQAGGSGRAARTRELIEPIDMARAIWRRAAPDLAAVRRYFLGRAVPEAVLTAARLREFRYLGECPCVAWDRNASPAGLPIAPAVMALVRVPTLLDSGRIEFIPTGLHVTYLNPGGDGTMTRRKPWARPGDDDPLLPKRRMLGAVKGGCVLLGEYAPGAHLWIGEGNETVLSGMGLHQRAGASGCLNAGGANQVGIATLSLDNLQGGVRLWNGRVWPLHRIEPDPERPAFAIPGHRGPVTGLIDSDMAPLRGRRARPGAAPVEAATPEFVGEHLVERKGGPIVRRAITGAERARICAELFVKRWRGVTSGAVDALRAPAGMDFNDAARAIAAEQLGMVA